MTLRTTIAPACCLPLLLACVPTARAQDLDPEFRPVLVSAELTAPVVRPGDLVAISLRFRNEGTRPAASDYRVFLHLEDAARTCETMAAHWDHAPTRATSAWEPGEEIVDGPLIFTVPADKGEGEFFLHVGLFDFAGSGQRLLETYAETTLRISRDAPSSADLAPEPLADEVVRARGQALAERIPADRAATLTGPTWRFSVDRETGAWALLDTATGVTWASDPVEPSFGSIVLGNGVRRVTCPVTSFAEVRESPEELALVCRPVVHEARTGATVTFTIRKQTAPEGIRLAYESTAEGPWRVEGATLLERALGVTDAEGGVCYIPYRLGVERKAASLPGRESWRTYDGITMQMAGAVKQGSAVLVNWDGVGVSLATETQWLDTPLVPGARLRTLSLELQGPAGSCTVHPLGRGGYVEIAHAYRALAKAKGWLETWAEKRTSYPTVDRIFGATDFKPFVYSGVMPGSVYSTDGQEHHWVNFTFDEIARVAEHWRRDLQIDRASVVLAGWINGGYDIRHPDVLPAAADCGGDAGLRDAARRIRDCGYLFGLHDNYQDMYQDAPSWDLKWLNKDAEGKPRMGGNWAGGQAWQVCAEQQVALASRPETNLPKIAELFGPTIYFIDTVFAWPLVTCEDPAHPMTRADDLRWKTELSLTAKRWFGLFGSEEGREWAVPCADYLEGLFGHQTETPTGEVIPLFPLVYSDCVQIMTHQGQRMGAGDAKRILDHVLFAEMSLPEFGAHLYWEGAAGQPAALPVLPLAPVVKPTGARTFEITYRWQVEARPESDCSVFVHFTHPESTRGEGIAYQNDHMPTPPTSQWSPGSVVEDGPHTVEIPAEFEGTAEIRLGMIAGDARQQLSDAAGDGGRVLVGRVTATGGEVTFEPVAIERRAALWARGDGGWGEALCPTDRVIKNMWEVLSPLNVLTAERPLDAHEFLTEDRGLQRTRFGDCTITATYDKPAEVGDVALPAFGFLVESPTFVAFLATRYGGLEYATPTLFTVRSLDGKPIADSGRVRIYHGFGDPRVRVAGREHTVAREATVTKP